MRLITRALIGLACAVSLSFAALAAEKVNIGIVTGPTFAHTYAAQKFKEEVDRAWSACIFWITVFAMSPIPSVR